MDGLKLRRTVNQTVQDIDDAGLAGRTILQCQLDSDQDGLLIVPQHQGKNFHHLAIAARLLQEQSLQSFERVWQLGKRRTVAQCAGLALQYGQEMATVMDRTPRALVIALNDARVFTDDLAFGHDDQAVGINLQAHGPVGIRGRHAVAIALKVNQAGGRDSFGMLDKAVKWPRHGHRTCISWVCRG